MNLVMIIQKVDEEDSVFGANISWIRSLASRVEKLFVIGLSSGRYSLPSNVMVFSLGKERGYGRLRKFLRLQYFMFKLHLRFGLDGIFVHQGQIYGPLLVHFRFLGIPIILFKAHGSLPRSIKHFLPFFDIITTTTPDTFPVDTAKKIAVGQGIDVERFKFVESNSMARREKSKPLIISTGRISPMKGYEVLIDAAALLNEGSQSLLRFEVYGEPHVKTDDDYERQLKEQLIRSDLMKDFSFKGPVLNSALPEKLSRSVLFVDASTGESALNKGMLEAMACELPVLTANEKFIPLFGSHADLLIYRRGDAGDLAAKIRNYLALSAKQKRSIGVQMRQMVLENHNVANLMDKIVSILERLRVTKAV
jgi:glycosyltransferase involved in cell wall biosynthesis